MKLTTLLAAGVIAALAAGAATGHPNHAPTNIKDPISMRQALMADNGALAKMGFAMIKGKTEFNPVAAKAILHGIHAVSVGLNRLFPKGSTSPTSAASDKIWQERKAFRKAVAKFVADAEAATKADVSDLESFKAQLGAVAANCKACHEAYRVKKN